MIDHEFILSLLETNFFYSVAAQFILYCKILFEIFHCGLINIMRKCFNYFFNKIGFHNKYSSIIYIFYQT
jgi:hypothetical protein